MKVLTEGAMGLDKNNVLVWLTMVFIIVVDMIPLSESRLPAELIASVPDEFIFLDIIFKLQALIYDGFWMDALSIGTPYGYGYVYWLMVAVVGMPVKELDYSSQVLFYRMVHLIFKCVALCFLWKASVFRGGARRGALALLLFLSLPGFWFYGKVISCEYVILALISITTYYIVKDDFSYKSNYWRACFFLGLAIGIKMNMGLMFLLPIIYVLSTGINKNKLLMIAKSGFCIIGIFLLANLTIITKNGRDIFLQWIEISRHVLTEPSVDHFIQYYNLNSLTWDRIPLGGMAIDFFPIWFLCFFIVVLLVAVKYKKTDGYVLALGITSLMWVSFVMFAQGFFYWYLFAPVMVFLYFITTSIKEDKTTDCLLLIMVVALLVCNFQRIEYRYGYRLQINSDVRDSYIESLSVRDYLVKNNAKGTVMFDSTLALEFPATDGLTCSYSGVLNSELQNNNFEILHEDMLKKILRVTYNNNYEIVNNETDINWIYIRNDIDIPGYKLVVQNDKGYLYKKRF